MSHRDAQFQAARPCVEQLLDQFSAGSLWLSDSLLHPTKDPSHVHQVPGSDLEAWVTLVSSKIENPLVEEHCSVDQTVWAHSHGRSVW